MKKTLVIGGNSTIIDDVVEKLEKNDYEITLMTYRAEQNLKKFRNYEKYTWKYLNLLEENSVVDFISRIPDNYYDLVIFTPTHESGQRDPLATTREYYEDLFGKFLINSMDLIRNLIFKKMKNDATFVFTSSEAANVPTDMHDYATGKAALQAYVRSLSKKASDKTVFIIATTMIFESSSYEHHGPDYYKNDQGRLVYKDQIADIILKSDKDDNGKIFTLGFIPTKIEAFNDHAGVIYPYSNLTHSKGNWYNNRQNNRYEAD